jgi:uncharacterized oxidoreductase
MPTLEGLINNAGIQRRVGIASDRSPWAEAQNEIDILFAAPVHLGQLLVPHMLAHGRPSVLVNVTSGGAFFPQPFAPLHTALTWTYFATPSSHSWTAPTRKSASVQPLHPTSRSNVLPSGAPSTPWPNASTCPSTGPTGA